MPAAAPCAIPRRQPPRHDLLNIEFSSVADAATRDAGDAAIAARFFADFALATFISFMVISTLFQSFSASC